MSFLFPSSTLTFEAAMRDIARGTNPKSRVLAAQALGDVKDATEKRRAVEALILALEDDHPEVRMEAASSLGELRDSSAVPSLIKRLDDGTAPVRQHAAIALGTIGHHDAFEPLVDALQKGPPDLRFQAATSLVELDAKRAYDPIVKSLADSDPQVVSAAALALGAIGDARAIDKLVAHLDHKEANTRFDVAYALSELGDGRGRASLVRALSDVDRAWDAVTALGKLGTADDAEALGQALTAKSTPPEAIVLAAGKLLELQPEGPYRDPARRVLLAGLAARKGHVRGLAIEQLGAVAGAWGTAPLEKLARGGKGADFVEAIAAALKAIETRGAS